MYSLDVGIVAYKEQVLQNRQQIRLARGIGDRAAKHIETQARIIQVEPHIIKAPNELIEILFFVLFENLELRLQVGAVALAQFLQSHSIPY